MLRAVLPRGVWVLALLLLSRLCCAFEPIQGDFLAKSDCAATRSIRDDGNSGNVRLAAGKSYSVQGLNKPDGSYLQIRVTGVRPELRWVSRDCGVLSAITSSSAGRSREHESSGEAVYVLALSWQPAFCETRPSVRECQDSSGNSPSATGFSLHGLWNRPIYCGVSDADRDNDSRHRWNLLPEPSISEDTRRRLNMAMPGTLSLLQRHEYVKHGSCFDGGADVYFRTALNLLEQVNRSKLRDFMVTKVGARVSLAELRKAFDESFGAGAGAALVMNCKGDADSHRTLITEVLLSIKGRLLENSSLREVLVPAAAVGRSCEQGIIDPAGVSS